MDIFESRYFVLNKTCMESLGLWPYASRAKNYSRRLGLAVFIVACYVPQFMRLQQCFGEDMDTMVQNIGVMLYIFAITIKIITSITSEDKMKIVYEKTAKSFQMIVDENERNILFEYAERGRMLTTGFIVYMCVAWVVFVSLPICPILLDGLLPLENASRPRIFIWNGEYLVDPVQHYFKIYAFECCLTLFTMYVVCSIGPMYQSLVESCLALFAILSFTRSIEASYTTYFLIEMGITILLLSVISVVLISNLNRLFDSLRYTMIIFGVMMHMFLLTWPSQKMITHSTGLFQDTYMNEWYNCSIRCQNLLKFMALRCVEPAQLTAGGLYVMNFENYASLVKTSASYITALLSFR